MDSVGGYDVNFNLPKNVDWEKIGKRITEPLTDADLERYFGSGVHSEVIKYSELAKYNTIDELLPKPFDFRILLMEQETNSGHWVLIMKYGNTIENFNSYGIDIDKQKGMLNRAMNKVLGQEKNYLSKLVARSPYKYVVNKHPFQKSGNDYNTCGRWVALRIITAKDMNMSLKDFTSMIEQATRQMRINGDALVSLWIS